MQRDAYYNKTIPDFRDFDTVREVTDGEIAGPISELMNAKEQYLNTRSASIKEELVTDMLVAISKLERALYSKWEDR
jgi:hypothetical protein